MSAATFEESTTGVRCTVQVPPGFVTHAKLVRGLGYPWELATVRNVEIPHEIDAEGYGFPQVGALPSRGGLLWLIVGDRDYDSYQDRLGSADDPEATPPAFSVTRVGGGRVVRTESGLTDDEQRPNRWENIRSWSRTIDLDGTKYCDVWVFTGVSPFAPVDTLSNTVGTLELEF